MDENIVIINDLVNEKLKEEGLDPDKYSHDITSFNSTGRKAITILDNCQEIDKYYILIGLTKYNRDWKVTYYKHTKDSNCSFDAIDAMNDADSILNY